MDTEEFTKQSIEVADFVARLDKFTNPEEAQEWKEISDLAKSSPSIISAKKLVDHVYPETIWLVKDLVPATGFTAVTGAPFSYKSFITEHIAICVATGNLVFGQFEVSQGAVLIIDKENGKSLIKDRLLKLGFTEDPPIFFLDNPEIFNLDNAEVIAEVQQFIKDNNIKLIILDSLVHVHRGDENDSTAIAKTFEHLKTLGSALMFVHHHRKSIKFFTGTVLESIRGSSDIGAELEAHIALDTTPEGIRVTQGKNRWGQLLPPFMIQPLITETMATFSYLGEVQDATSKGDEAKKLIMTALESQIEMSRRMIIDMLAGKTSERVISTQLKRLEEDNFITSETKNREKWYTLCEKGLLQPLLQNAKDEFSPLEQYYQENFDD